MRTAVKCAQTRETMPLRVAVKANYRLHTGGIFGWEISEAHTCFWGYMHVRRNFPWKRCKNPLRHLARTEQSQKHTNHAKAHLPSSFIFIESFSTWGRDSFKCPDTQTPLLTGRCGKHTDTDPGQEVTESNKNSICFDLDGGVQWELVLPHGEMSWGG